MMASFFRDRRKMSIAALAVAAVFFVAVNSLANGLFRGATLDFTEDKVFTLSPGTLKVLSKIDEPITLRFYYSPKLGKEVPSFGAYAARVREMLERYRSLSRGRIKLEIYNPVPFSDAEDRAAGYQLRSIPVNQTGEQVFFGLVGTNGVDDQEAIPFFHPTRSRFIEYDLTRMVLSLAQPKRKVVGVISSLPVNGQFMSPRNMKPPWPIMDEIRSIFETRTVPSKAEEIAKDIDVLLVIHPRNLSDRQLYAIDQYVLKGGKALVFVDPVPEVDRSRRSVFGIAPVGPASDLPKLFKAWGIQRVPDKVATDYTLAVRVNVGRGARSNVADFVAWMQLDGENINRSDPVTAGLTRMIVATSGFIRRLAKATTEVTPLMFTGKRAQALEASKVRFSPNVQKLLNDYKPGSERLVLGVRIRGNVKSAFPKGRPGKSKLEQLDPKGDKAKKKKKAPAKHLAESKQPVDLIVVADVDFMQDQYWRNRQSFFGTMIDLPTSGNADFVINALDNLSGANTLIGLRGRGQAARPFTLVQKLRVQAARRLQTKEKELTQQLKTTQEKLKGLRTLRDKDGRLILTKAQIKAIEDFRTQMITIRQQLRGVQLALREDIDSLDTYLKLINIALIPFLIALAAIFLGVVRRRRGRPAAA